MSEKITQEEKAIVKTAIKRFIYDLDHQYIPNHKNLKEKERCINEVRNLESFEKKLEKL